MDQDAQEAAPVQNRVKTSITETFASLRFRNYRLYFSGQMVSNIGNWLTNITLTLLVLERTHSGLAVGLLAACQFGPILLLSAYGGVIADRYNKRKLLLITQTLEMIQSFALAILAFIPHSPVWGFYVIAAAGGIMLAFDNPLRRSFVSEMVPAKSLPNAVILNSLIINVARITGPALAGLLVVLVGYGWAFTVDGISYLFVISCLLLMREADLYRARIVEVRKRAIRAGLTYIRHNPLLLINFVMLFIIGTLSYNFNTTLPLFTTQTLHASNGVYTLLYSLMSVGSVVTALVIARRGVVRLEHVIGGAVVLGAAMLFLAVTPSVPFAAAITLFLGVGSMLYTTATSSLVQLNTAAHFRGRVLALQTMLLLGTTPLGAPLLGWLADAFGGRAPLLLGGIAACLSAGCGYIWARKAALLA